MLGTDPAKKFAAAIGTAFDQGFAVVGKNTEQAGRCRIISQIIVHHGFSKDNIAHGSTGRFGDHDAVAKGQLPGDEPSFRHLICNRLKGFSVQLQLPFLCWRFEWRAKDNDEPQGVSPPRSDAVVEFGRNVDDAPCRTLPGRVASQFHQRLTL